MRAGNARTAGFKCLDDTGVIGTYEECKAFYRENRGVCTRVGVKLAPDEDPEKAFDAATMGVILGLCYDTRKWTWTFSPSKIKKLEIQLHEILAKDEVEASLLKSVAGKLNHYHRVISPRGKFERGYMVYKAADSDNKEGMVDVREGNLKRQVLFWLRNLQLSKEGLPIPDPFPSFRSCPYILYPDAAGASASNLKLGMGGVAWNVPGRPMMMMAWPLRLRQASGGLCFAKKLTFLEACAALATLCGVVGNMKGGSCMIYTDNSGLASAWLKGHSRCPFTYVVMKALSEVAYYADIQLRVVWTRRCTSEGELTADLLSKGRLAEAVRVAEVTDLIPMRVPRTLARWLHKPVAVRELGAAVCEEISRRNTLLPREPEDRDMVNRLLWREK